MGNGRLYVCDSSNVAPVFFIFSSDLEMRKTVFSVLLLLVVVGVLFAYYSRPTTMLASDGWTRVAPPGSPMAGYFELHNHSDSDYFLVSASSADFGHVMVHRSFEEGGIVKMEHIDAVEVAKGKNVVFEPGGFHLMLMQRNREFNVGDQSRVVLHFKGGEKMELDLDVADVNGQAHGHSNH